MGRVESGEVAGGRRRHRAALGASSGSGRSSSAASRLPRAIHEQSVTLLLEDEIDISRGDLIVKSAEAREPVKQIEATVLAVRDPAVACTHHLVRHTTREVKGQAREDRLPPGREYPGKGKATTGLAMNDIARSRSSSPSRSSPTATENRATGAFIIIDGESTNNTVGAGMIG